MPVHLLAYSGAVESATSPVTLTGLVDPVITRSQTSALYVLQQRLLCLAGVGMSITAERVQLSSPTLRQINIPFFRPIILAAEPADLSEIDWKGDQPILLPALEELGPLFTSGAAAPEDAFFLLWIADQIMPIPAGPVIRVRATSAMVATAGQWTLGSYVMDQALPSGNYALVGSEHISTTGIAHRFAIFNQVFRPGALSHQLVSDRQDRHLMERGLGAYGQFLNTAMPQIEVLCTAADAAHEIYMDLVPIGGQIAI